MNISNLIQDIRYGSRQLRKSPGFALTAITVLALGLGANVAVLTLVDGILLRPLPYFKSDRLAFIDGPSIDGFSSWWSYADMRQLGDAAGTTVETAMMLNQLSASVVGPGGRLQIRTIEVTSNLPHMLGVQPAMGRTFRGDENEPGKGHVMLLSNEVWRRLYNSDPAVVGKTILVKGQVNTIIGVMPQGFSFPYGETMQVWSPAAITAAARTAMSGQDQLLGTLFARLPEGMTAAQLAAQLTTAQARIAKQSPTASIPREITVTTYQSSLNHAAQKPLALLYAVVAGIWALACLNVTSLMLARAVARTREQAVRAALGATRTRLIQQAVVESLLLSAIGSMFGLIWGELILKLLWRQIKQSLPLTNAVHLEWRVIAALAVLSTITALIVGVFPALRASGRSVQTSLQGVNSTATQSQHRTREILVVGQLALTLVFLVGAGLFLRTVHALREVPLGFSEQNVLTGGIILNPASSGDSTNGAGQPDVVTTAYAPLLARLQATPGVQVAALSSVLPMRGEFAVGLAGDLDHKKVPGSETPQADGRIASAGLIEAMGIPMVRGRFFNEQDTAVSPVVVVVNQAFANKYLHGVDPLGHTFSIGDGRFDDAHIVGVIGDVKQTNLTRATKPEIYFCMAQMAPGKPLYGIAAAFMQVAIRGRIPADYLRSQFDKALHEVAPDATTTDVKTIHEAVEDSFGSQTLTAYLLEAFAGLALLIATVGLYGLLSFVVAQRTREIGLRLALGAQKGNILRLVLNRAILLIAAGLACGSLMAWFAVSLARSYLFGVQLHDGLTFVAVATILAGASMIAALMPARQAASIEPIVALRSE